ncbi:MAG: hypothetical protein Q9160_004281 [Pyrenula sp. 1 TL-2023]
MEKVVKGATKIKVSGAQPGAHCERIYANLSLQLAAPKAKYVETILSATRGGEAGVAEIFRTLQNRLRDSTWTIVFKSLLVVHLMVREGEADVTLRYLAESPRRLAISNFTEVMNEGTINVLEHYFEMSKPDATRALQIYKTFSRQTELVVQYLSVARQYELSTRLEIPKLKHAPTSLTNSLEEYLGDPDFEINRRQYLAQQDAKKSGGRKTATLSAFDKEIKADSSFPSSKPTTITPAKPAARGPAPDLIDFFESIEDNQQTMAQQAPQQPTFNGYQQSQPIQQTGFVPQQQQVFPPQQPQAMQQPQANTNPFFIQDQAPSFSQQAPQQPQQAPQLPPLQPDFTGAGFGGYSAQPQSHPTFPSTYNSFQSSLSSIPQESAASFPPQSTAALSTGQQPFSPQTSNPFRQSTLSSQPSGPSYASMSPPLSANLNRQSTNPFAKPAQQQQQQQSGQSNFSLQNNSNSPFTSPPPQQIQAQPLQPQRTGTNPFARNLSPAPTTPAEPLRPNPTGSTNPFRQSTFINQSTGQGWQHSTNGTMGGFGMNSVQTTPVFPRPGG